MRKELVIHKFWGALQAVNTRLHPHFLRFRPREQAGVEAPAEHTVRSFRQFSRWASIIALVVGYHVVLGWAFGIPILKTPWSGFSTMKLNEAVCSLFAGVALFGLTQQGHTRPKQRILWLTCAGLAALVAAGRRAGP